MSMVIGKEARASLEGALAGKAHGMRPRVAKVLEMCSDAPEVGGAEPVAFISRTREGDVLDVNRQFDAPRVTPLYTHPPEVGLPPGWVAVPVEPTREMLWVDTEVAGNSHWHGDVEISEKRLQELWADMLSAAPPCPGVVSMPGADKEAGDE